MDIVVVEEVQDGVNILYCKLKVNDNMSYYKSMSENGMHIYTRTPRLRIKYSFTTHRAGESVYYY